LLFVWKPQAPSPVPLDPPFIGPSTAEAVWTIPRNTPAGTYRLRHEGAAQAPGAPRVEYSGGSSPFVVAAAVSGCP
jgi:neutral ceramidase